MSKLYKKLRNKNIQVLINNAAIDAVPKVIQKTNMKYQYRCMVERN